MTNWPHHNNTRASQHFHQNWILFQYLQCLQNVRVFSNTKNLASPHRCSIKEDLIEASWDSRIIM